MARRKTKRPGKPRTFARAWWSATLFLSVGFFPTFFLRHPVFSMSAAAGIIMLYGARSANMKRAVLWGFGLGLTAGIGIWTGQVKAGLSPELERAALVHAGATVLLCTAVAAFFQHVVAKRRRMMEENW